MPELRFSESVPLTLGVELELQLVNTRDYNLAPDADDLLRRASGATHGAELKPEITQSMIEINSSVHSSYSDLLHQLRAARDAIATHARQMNVAVAGGGTHPFQKWSERKIFPTERFVSVSEKYGFLAKQFTVFGQHVHIGCASADDAIYLTHALSRYVPHFIALAASSPFYQGIDTLFDSSRLSVVNAFPLSGTMPFVNDWNGFDRYFNTMYDFGIVQSMKDFYWDVRPKPEFGTVEIRVCDTPLTVDRAAQIAAYAQALARRLFARRVDWITPELYLVHGYNRFQACRHGLQGSLIDTATRETVTIADDIVRTFRELDADVDALGSRSAFDALDAEVRRDGNDAAWLRQIYTSGRTLPDVVREQAQRWMNG